MKYHPQYPLATKPFKKFTKNELDKLKKEEAEAATIAYKLAKRLGQRDKDHAKIYGEYLTHKHNLADIRQFERTGEWTGVFVPGSPPTEIFHRVVAPAYNEDGSLKSAPKGTVVDCFNRITNDEDVTYE